MAHFLFKVFQVIVFYPFMNLIVRCTYKLVPGEDAAETGGNFKVQFISGKLPNPAVAILMAVQEMERMANMAIDNLNLAVNCLIDHDVEKSKQVLETERYIDYLDEQVSNYLVKINQNTLPIADANMIAAYFHVVSDIERIGDHAESIVEIIPQLYENGLTLSEDSARELEEMMKLINKILRESVEMFVTGETVHMQEISDIENTIDQMERSLQRTHILRLNEGKCSAQAGIYFSDVVSGLERVADHAINIAFSLIEARS